MNDVASTEPDEKASHNEHGMQRLSIESVEIFYEKPRGMIRGILFLAHGCSHSKEDWWDTCDNSLGYPRKGLSFLLL